MAWFKKDKRSPRTVSPLTVVSDKLRYHVANLQGIGARARQEDSFSVLNALDESLHERNGMLLCVCDGMGGMKDGKLASETAAAVIRNVFMSLDTAADIPEQLIYGIYRATDSVLSKLDGDGGSTVVECVVIHERLYYISVGDSYLYLFRGGKLLRINSEHNMCHQRYLENIRDGDLDAVECRNDSEAAMLTSFLGMAGELIIDNNADPIPLIKGDVLLVCSDGVCNALSKDELIAALDCDSVHQMCRNIEKAVTDHADPNQDNYTAVILRCV